jgi:hypothetical protein
MKAKVTSIVLPFAPDARPPAASAAADTPASLKR